MQASEARCEFILPCGVSSRATRARASETQVGGVPSKQLHFALKPAVLARADARIDRIIEHFRLRETGVARVHLWDHMWPISLASRSNGVPIETFLVANDWRQEVPRKSGSLTAFFERTNALLRLSYFEYAEHGVDSISRSIVETQGNCESPFEEEVAGALTRHGLEPVPQVGCGGFRIALKHPAHSALYCLGIECDGATYHSSKTARDRDRN